MNSIGFHRFFPYGEYLLGKTDSDWFAGGWQVYEKGDGAFHHYGDWLIDKEKLKVELPIGEVGLEWVDLEQPHKPTMFEKFKALFGVKYPDTDYVRPTRNAIVVVDYGGLMEVAEAKPHTDGGCTWVTELNTYLRPKRWAYIPEEIFNKYGYGREKKKDIV